MCAMQTSKWLKSYQLVAWVQSKGWSSSATSLSSKTQKLNSRPLSNPFVIDKEKVSVNTGLIKLRRCQVTSTNTF